MAFFECISTSDIFEMAMTIVERGKRKGNLPGMEETEDLELCKLFRTQSFTENKFSFTVRANF